MKQVKKLLTSFTFWLFLIGIAVVIFHASGQDDKGILMYGFNPVLGRMASNWKVRRLMDTVPYGWYIASLLTHIGFGLLLDLLKAGIQKIKKQQAGETRK